MAKKNNNDVAVSLLSYLLIGVIWYFVDKNVQNSYTKFHVKQAINLFISSIVGSIISMILMFIPIIGWLVSILIHILILVLFIIGIINSVNHEKKELPIIGSFADNYLKF